jgi:Glycosyltransferase family 87
MTTGQPATAHPGRLAELVLRRRRLIIGTVAATLFLMLIVAFAGPLRRSAGWAYDFSAYYAAVQRLVQTGTPYETATLSGTFHHGSFGLYDYSPLPVAVILPLAGLALNEAALIYLIVRLALLLALCALMPVRREVRLAMLGVASISAPVLLDLNLGNVSLVVTFLAVIAWRYLDRPAGSAAVAAALAVRPTIALVLGWWVLRGRWRSLLWVAVAVSVLVLLSLPLVGLRSWWDYLTVLRNLSGLENLSRNLALGPVVGRLGMADWVATIAQFAGYGIAAGAVVLSLRRDRELSFVVTLGATLLISPLLWDHYLTNLLVPAAFLANRGRWPALFLPLLCWLPQDLLPVVALVATLLPFAAPDQGEPAGPLAGRIVKWQSTPRSTARA